MALLRGHSFLGLSETMRRVQAIYKMVGLLDERTRRINLDTERSGFSLVEAKTSSGALLVGQKRKILRACVTDMLILCTPTGY